MDPITLILTALAASAASYGQTSASSAIKDAYSGLKALLQRKLEDKPDAELALVAYESDPTTWEDPLKNALEQSQIYQDEDVIQAAQVLLTLVQPQQAAMGKYIIQHYIQGDHRESNGNSIHTHLQIPFELILGVEQRLNKDNTQFHRRDKQLMFTIMFIALTGFVGLIVAVTTTLIHGSANSMIIALLAAAVACIFLEGLAGLFFKRSKEARKLLNSYYSDKLIELERISQAIKLALSASEEAQDRTLEMIIPQLIDFSFEEGENTRINIDRIAKDKSTSLT